MELSKRLCRIGEFVTPGHRLADVGTDHGLIPVHLVSTGRIPSAIAMDLRTAPLEKAKVRIREQGLSDKIETRLSDGLKNLQDNEADTVLIAGMGGILMREILQEGKRCRAWVKEYILSPQSAWREFRIFLRENGYVTTEEEMVFEDGKYYLILRAIPRPILRKIENPTSFFDEKRRNLYDCFGEYLIKNRHPVLRNFLEKEKRQVQGILSSMETAPESTALLRRRKELFEYLMMLREADYEMQ